MKKIFLFISVALLLFATVASADQSFLLGGGASQRIFVNNRILATIEGKSISVIDVMKKMDMLFYKQFPQYTSSVEARYQFYNTNWRYVLRELIDKELVLADAKEKKLPVNAGDVRQEMEMMFGPNIIVNLDKVGLTFEEAWKMVQDEIIIRRMIYMRANIKAFAKVTPQDVRQAYEKYAKDSVRPDQWEYIVISIRDSDTTRAANAAALAHRLLTEDKVPLVKLAERLKTTPPYQDNTKVTLSELNRHEDKELSPAYKEILNTLQNDSFSRPSAHQSRSDKSTVFRIFYLKEKIIGGVPPFNEVESKLKEQLTEIAVDEATEAYIKQLRSHYHVEETHLKEQVSEEFKPFELKT